jgi:hypothetical protein
LFQNFEREFHFNLHLFVDVTKMVLLSRHCVLLAPRRVVVVASIISVALVVAGYGAEVLFAAVGLAPAALGLIVVPIPALAAEGGCFSLN